MTGLHYRRSLASRVTLLTTMAVGLAVAFVALGSYITVRIQMQHALDASLLERAERVARTPTIVEVTRGWELPSWPLGAADVSIIYISPDHVPYSIDGSEPTFTLGAPEMDVVDHEYSHSLRTIHSEGVRYRVVAVPAPGGGAVVIAQSMDPQDRVLDRLGLVMLLLGGAGVIAAGLAGWGVARNGLRPVRRLTLAAEEIARTEDLTPIQVEGNDEIARLASAFNQMLAALAASRERQRQLIADAGHELRTPLTSLRTNLDLLLMADSMSSPGAPGGMSPQARAELLDDVRAQIEEMTTLIGDLVELAREEPLAHAVEHVDFGEIVEQALTRVRRRAPAVAWDVETEPWWVYGESGALERAVTNLLDNAAKWSPPDGTVTVRLRSGVLTVCDEGPGIAESDLPFVFDRFFRSTESRSMPGSGLGLSIVRSIATRHSGHVEAARSPSGGACLTLMLPGRPAPVPAS